MMIKDLPLAVRSAVQRTCLLTVLLMALGVGTSEATTITFDGLVGPNFTPFATYNEGGFTVTALLGSWFEAHLFGNPVPDIFGTSATSAVGVTRQGGGTFTFSSVDIGNAAEPDLPLAFTIEGVLNNAVLFSTGGSKNNLGFGAFPGGSPSTAIDLLRISFASQTSSYNIDNIIVNVPEPASLMMMSVGVFGLVVVRRHWQRHRLWQRLLGASV
jgi:hypothetical protein